MAVVGYRLFNLRDGDRFGSRFRGVNSLLVDQSLQAVVVDRRAWHGDGSHATGVPRRRPDRRWWFLSLRNESPNEGHEQHRHETRFHKSPPPEESVRRIKFPERLTIEAEYYVTP